MAIAAARASVSTEAVRLELERVLRSRVFSASTRLCKFLRFTVEYTLTGKAELIKEYLIGSMVYDRRPPYNPTVDSIVRTEARRLRIKLKQYYETEGKHDSIMIRFEVGKYVPSFVQRTSISEMGPFSSADGPAGAVEQNHMLIDAWPVRDLAQTEFSAAFAKGLSEEIAKVLVHRGMCSAMAGSSRLGAGRLLSDELVPWSSDFLLEGSIREAEGGLSVMVKLIRADRMRIA